MMKKMSKNSKYQAQVLSQLGGQEDPSRGDEHKREGGRQ